MISTINCRGFFSYLYLTSGLNSFFNSPLYFWSSFPSKSPFYVLLAIIDLSIRTDSTYNFILYKICPMKKKPDIIYFNIKHLFASKKILFKLSRQNVNLNILLIMAAQNIGQGQ